MPSLPTPTSTTNRWPRFCSASLLRFTQPLKMDAPGIAIDVTDPVAWSAVWVVEPIVVRVVASVIIAVMGVGLAWFMWRRRGDDSEALFYLWVLFSLLVIPHTERYNHTLLLPALAWLWGRGEQGRTFAMLAYFLAALARLTYLWLQILPAPWGPLMIGSGLYAVLAAGLGIMLAMRAGLRAPEPDHAAASQTQN